MLARSHVPTTLIFKGMCCSTLVEFTKDVDHTYLLNHGLAIIEGCIRELRLRVVEKIFLEKQFRVKLHTLLLMGQG